MLDFLDKRLLFVTGKGGVGKSTISVALGIRAALEGKRTIICEVAASENTSRMFRQEEVGFREVELANDLWAISIDPDDSMREYVLLQLRVKAMRDLLFRSRLFTYLADATPGLNELVTIGKIWELAQLDRKIKHGRKYDLVIVDSPATGHGVSFMRTPRVFANIAKVGPMYNQASELDALITDHEQTGAVVVCLPEEMPVNETVKLEADLRDDIDVAVDRVIMNGMYPARFATAERTELETMAASGDQIVRAAGMAAVSESRRREAQEEQLERLRESITSTPITTLPFLFEPELSLEAARELGEAID